MTFNYAPIAREAQTVLAEFGRDIILRNNSIGVYDPETGASTAAASTDSTRKGVLLDFKTGQAEERGNLIQVGDKRLILEPGVVPSPEDNVVVGSVVYNIVSVGEVNPAGTPVLYILHLRHG